MLFKLTKAILMWNKLRETFCLYTGEIQTRTTFYLPKSKHYLRIECFGDDGKQCFVMFFF